MLEFEYVNRKSKVLESIEVGDYFINNDDNASDLMVIIDCETNLNLLNVNSGFTIFQAKKSKGYIINYLNEENYKKAKVKLVIQEE